MPEIPELENFDVVFGAEPDSNHVLLYARETARTFLISEGFAPDQKLWRPVEDLPHWSVLPFGGSTEIPAELA